MITTLTLRNVTFALYGFPVYIALASATLVVLVERPRLRRLVVRTAATRKS